MTITVEVLNNSAFNLLSDMELLDLIRLKVPAKTVFTTSEKLSSQFAGALKLTNAKYESYQNMLQEIRSTQSSIKSGK